MIPEDCASRVGSRTRFTRNDDGLLHIYYSRRRRTRRGSSSTSADILISSTPMRSLLIVMIVMVVGGVVFADTRYQLEVKEGWQQVNGPTKNRVPSCGRRAADFIAKIGILQVDVANDITVNGIAWKPGPRSANRLSVVNDQLLEGFVLQITFYRERASAKGMLVVVGLSNDVIQCGDALRLEGTYAQ